MMFGSRVRYGITYKTNQKSFDIYRRKYEHSFKIPINSSNLEGAIGLELHTMDTFLVAKVDTISVYDTDTFEVLGQVPITLLKADTREPNQVIAMQKCQNEEYIAVISGKILIMNEQKTNQLFILKRQRNQNGERDTFVQYKRVLLKDLAEFRQVSMNFHFKQTSGVVKNTLIFAKIDKIFELNFETEQLQVIHKFSAPLNRQPQFFKPNEHQKIFMISSPDDCMYLNIETKK